MLLDELSKHRCMGNVMKISLPFPKGVFYVISRHEYHALLALGKDIPLKYVFKHIFLSIVLFKPDNHFSFPLVCLNLLVIYMI